MNEKHLEQLREIFPEASVLFDRIGSRVFRACNIYLVFWHVNGVYYLKRFDTDQVFAQSRNFKVFLKKVKQTREKMEKEKFKKDLMMNVTRTMLEEHGFSIEVFENPDFIGINANQPYPLVGLMQMKIEPDRIQVYYLYRTIYYERGEPQNLINEAVERMVEISKKEIEELTSFRSDQETSCEADQ